MVLFALLLMGKQYILPVKLKQEKLLKKGILKITAGYSLQS